LEIKRLKYIDKTYLITLLVLIVFGLVVLASASSTVSNDPYFYIKKQLVFIFLGIIAIFIILRADYVELKRYSWFFYGLSVFLLVLVLLFGDEVRGTTGWISIGPLPAVQPAEFTKILLIVSFADFLNNRKGELNTLTQMLPCFFYIGVPFALIMMQPDLGTAVVYLAITLVMMYAAGANPKILITLLLSGVILITVVLWAHFEWGLPLPLQDYQLKRLVVFLDPYNDGQGGRGPGWNTIQSLIAIGSGGLMGKGLFNGTQVQLNFLPEHHTDFIYAVIGEELGFAGASLVLILYGILIIRAINISLNAKELYGTLMVLGITAMWLFHIFESIGMSIGLMPVTGIPLPFLSYGGSFMITNLVAVGLILNVNIRGKKIVF
jgi:rod shape determining protein RodA